MVRELVLIGGEEVGKTTLANALLGWDIFPQSQGDWYFPTIENASHMLSDTVRITDTPGYDLWENRVPAEVFRAVSQADTILVLLSEPLAEADVDLPTADPDWETDRAAERELLEQILSKANTRDIYFVIPFETGDWPEGKVPLEQGLFHARARFASLSEHGEAGFFCVDPMQALVAAIEADADAMNRSGLAMLKKGMRL